MKERNGVNNTDLKNRNKGIVLQLISCKDRISRIYIAKQIGLTKMTVTNIVNELISTGYVEEREAVENSSVGRNPVILDVAENSPYVIGLYISRTHVSVLTTNLKLHLMFQKRLPLKNETNDSLLKKVYELVDSAISYQKLHLPRSNPMGIGVSAIGPLDSTSGIILNPPNFFGVKNIPVLPLLKSRYCMPVFLENDMNAAALAERLYGLGKSYSNFIYMGISNGIGSGIISNGKLYRGKSGFVGEIGHMSIKFDGRLCACGNRGCLEMYANLPILLQNLRDITGDESISPKDFAALSEQPACKKIFEDMTDKLSIALINSVNILDPECIIIGHDGVNLPDVYLRRMQDNIKAHSLSGSYKSIPVIFSCFAENAPLVGSTCCILQKVFEGKLFK